MVVVKLLPFRTEDQNILLHTHKITKRFAVSFVSILISCVFMLALRIQIESHTQRPSSALTITKSIVVRKKQYFFSYKKEVAQTINLMKVNGKRC